MKLKNIFVFLMTIVFASQISAKDIWGDVQYKTRDISKALQENERILSVAKKIQCKYFETHKENTLLNTQSAKAFKDQEDLAKLKLASDVVNGFKNSYCSGEDRLNPESFAGSIHTRCDERCRSEFKSKLQVIGKYETSEMNVCLSACREYVLPFQETAKIVIEAAAFFPKERSEDCADNVNSNSRGAAKTSIIKEADGKKETNGNLAR